MDALQNRGVAVLLCVAMILAAAFLGTGSGLAQLRAQTEDSFYDAGQGTSLYAQLNTLAGEYYNMTVVAARYLPEDHESVAGIRQKRVELSTAATPGERHRIMEEMRDLAQSLQQILNAMELSQEDTDLLYRNAVNIEGALDKISRNPYNGAAAYYNNTLGRFPANLLGPITGARPLELYK